jgi:hypothetical protein
MAPLQMQIFLLGEMQMQKNIGGLKGLHLSVIWLGANLRTNIGKICVHRRLNYVLKICYQFYV